MRRKLNYELIEHLYESGLSTYEIAHAYNLKPNTIRHYLWRTGKIRKSPGIKTEKQVASALEKLGHKVKKQKGDNKYDLLVNGKRVDVKKATLNNKWGYKFEINHKESKLDNRDIIDYYLLVFCSDIKEVYSLDPEFTKHVSRSIGFPKEPTGSRLYPLQFVCYL